MTTLFDNWYQKLCDNKNVKKTHLLPIHLNGHDHSSWIIYLDYKGIRKLFHLNLFLTFPVSMLKIKQIKKGQLSHNHLLLRMEKSNRIVVFMSSTLPQTGIKASLCLFDLQHLWPVCFFVYRSWSCKACKPWTTPALPAILIYKQITSANISFVHYFLFWLYDRQISCPHPSVTVHF